MCALQVTLISNMIIPVCMTMSLYSFRACTNAVDEVYGSGSKVELPGPENGGEAVGLGASMIVVFFCLVISWSVCFIRIIYDNSFYIIAADRYEWINKKARNVLMSEARSPQVQRRGISVSEMLWTEKFAVSRANACLWATHSRAPYAFPDPDNDDDPLSHRAIITKYPGNLWIEKSLRAPYENGSQGSSKEEGDDSEPLF